MEITKEVAERIINSKVLIDEALVPYKGIAVSYVGYEDSEGQPFIWEDTDEPYAIVSFKAMNEHQLAQSVEEFSDEEYDDCVNHNLSMRMNVDKAREIYAGVTLGTLICHEVTVEDEDGNEVLALLPKAYSPTAAITAKKVSLSDLLAAKSGKKAKKAKIAEADDDDEEFTSKSDKKAKKDKSDKKDKKAKKAK